MEIAKLKVDNIWSGIKVDSHYGTICIKMVVGEKDVNHKYMDNLNVFIR